MKRTLYFTDDNRNTVYVFPNGNYRGFTVFPGGTMGDGGQYFWTQAEMNYSGNSSAQPLGRRITRKQAERKIGKRRVFRALLQRVGACALPEGA